MYMKDLFIAEATIQKQHVNVKGICQNTILGSFVDYRKKRSYNRVIDLHWTVKHFALKYI